MIKKSLMQYLILFLCITSVTANEVKSLTIDADVVDYNGKFIHLTGNSRVDHELGIVEAQRITLIPEKEGKKLRIAYLTMNEEIKIALHDGGKLSCAEAEIDHHTLKGNFSGGPQQEFVIYTDNLKGRNPQAPIFLEVKSCTMNAHLKRINQQNSSTLVISEVYANNQVSINYGGDFLVSAHKGLYERKSPLESHLTLFASKEKKRGCQVCSRNGDQIDASKIRINTLKRELMFDSPKGSILTAYNNENRKPIEFSCQEMVWNEPEDLLTLKEQVEVNYKGVGTLTNPQEIHIQRKTINGSKQLKFIDCEGKAVLNYYDDKKSENHVLTTHHRFVLDHQNMQAHLDSPRDSSNNVLEKQQVHFTDALGDIFADEVFVFYKEINKKVTPIKLFLKGNVWLLCRTYADKEDPGKVLQLAMADRVEYDILSKEMLCMADLNKRVLFFDKSNNLQISAPSVKAKRDMLTQKDSIQGIGDVRFSFIDKELEELKKRFGHIYE